LAGFLFVRGAGAGGLGAGAELVLKETIEYCKTREVFGKPVARWQANAHLLADLATELTAAKALVYHCCDMVNRGENAIKEVSMCKLFAGEVAQRVVDRCLQLHGGYGYIEEYHVCRAYRDTRLGTIGGGSSEVMRDIISRMMLM
jgi:alkylation response protein AidB-like acyl-CoA dehydrogenase